MSAESSDSEPELFPVEFSNNFSNFVYDDPLLLSGVLKAVAENDLEKVKLLISEGKSPNINDNNGNTPLHLAVIKNLPEILDFLLSEEDIIVNIRNFYGETPLFQAVRLAHKHLVERLIKCGANVNLSNYEDITPLHLSVKSPEIVHMLIKNGGNINAVDYSGETPLHEAVSEHCLEVVCMLLYYNADANKRCHNNITPFMKAIIHEDKSIQEALLEYVDDFNIATNDHMTTLALALTHNTPYVEEIINRGADINFRHGRFNTFLTCLAVQNTENFRHIWKEFKYQKLGNNGNYIVNLTDLTSPYFEEYLDVIIGTGNVEPLIQSLSVEDNLYIFIHKCVDLEVSVMIVTKFVLLLLSEGYDPSDIFLENIYKYYGHCNLFKMLLFMEIKKTEDVLTFPRFIYDITLTINNFLTNCDLMNLLNDNENVYCFIAFPNNRYLEQANEFLRTKYSEQICIYSLPSLLELARNKTRQYIVEKHKFHKPSQFYAYLKFVDIPLICKRILSFELPLYNKTYIN